MQKSAYGVGRFAASSFNEKKVLVSLRTSLFFFSLQLRFSFSYVSCDVVLNLGHQRRNGDERAPQRFGRQNAFQLRHLCGVNARVLRWKHLFNRLVRSSHPLGRAASHFPVERLHEPQLVMGLLALALVLVVDLVCDLVTQFAQRVECERRLHNDGDRNVQRGGS